jgi:predicted regulator of Ras-like GTPase activity (Roadblock/LC7/MglB family)
MVSKIERVLMELNENGGFKASLFSTPAGLLLASQKSEEVDEKTLAAMGSLLTDAAFKAQEDLGLSDLDTLRIGFIDDLIIMKNIILPNDAHFLLAILSKAPESKDVDKYYDELLEWAVENSKEELKKLSSI